MLVSPAGFAVHLHPGNEEAYHDERVHLAAPSTWEPAARGVYSVYAGPMLSGAAAHTPWFLVHLSGGFRAVNAAFVRACAEDDCPVADCTIKAELVEEEADLREEIAAQRLRDAPVANATPERDVPSFGSAAAAPPTSLHEVPPSPRRKRIVHDG